jgi:hypothetical protein
MDTLLFSVSNSELLLKLFLFDFSGLIISAFLSVFISVYVFISGDAIVSCFKYISHFDSNF